VGIFGDSGIRLIVSLHILQAENRQLPMIFL
jgi:hypothetical protein